MDLSFNKVKDVQHVKNQPAFKGVKGEFNMNNNPVFKFNPPPFDKENEKVTLEFVLLDYNEDKNQMEEPFKQSVTSKDFDGDKPLRISQEYLKKVNAKGFAYRYKISKKDKPEDVRYFLDSFAKIKTRDTQEKFNLVRLGDGYQIDPKMGAMRHSFLDSDAILDATGKLNTTDKHKTRNHFNKLGGSTKGLIELLKTGELDPYRYIISTPDIGNDPTSSHRYWPNNLYQTANMQDFKDLNYELFIRGKGYVADGAFTDQSLQSPMFQHVLKWGKKSPFYHMFKTDGSNQIMLGILPNDIKENEDSAYNHIGVRLVNNPNSAEYDKTKPILLQFYDDRLSSIEQRNDTTRLIDAYDSLPEDIFEITHNDDSVYPFYFEMDPVSLPDVKEKLALFKDKNAILLSEINEIMGKSKFLDFGPFAVAEDRHHAANATFWDGNRDIVKFNLSNPKDFVDGEMSDKNREGMENARNYLYGVARFHTEAIESDLLLRSTKLTKPERIKVAKANGVEDINSILFTKNQSHFPILERNKKAGEYISEFPLQSLETSPELSAIFAEPQFNKEFLEEEEFFERYSIEKDGSFRKIHPEDYFNEDKFQNNNAYAQMFKLVEGTINNVLTTIPEKNQDGHGSYKKYVVKVFANEIIRYIIASSLNPNCVNEKGEVDLEELKKVTLKSLAPNAKSPEDERKQVINKIKAGMKNVDMRPIEAKLVNELHNVSLSSFKDAETLLLQCNAGLNWRFDAAKDIGDLDSVRAGSKDFKDIWDGPEGVSTFWHDFIKTVKEYNPSSYIIAELTDLWSFYSGDNEEVQLAFDKNGINPSVKEANFLIDIGATTNSNYGQYFNKLSCFLGVNPEKAYDGMNDPVGRAGNLGQLRGAVNEFIGSSQPSSALLTHMFFDNHDKPRLLHCLPLNMQLFLCDTDNKSKNLSDYIKKLPQNEQTAFIERTKNLTNREDFTQINPMALAVGFMFEDEIDKTNASEEDKAKLKQALRELVNGQKTSKSRPNFKRAKSFGTKPYEITIREMYKRAGLTSNLDEDVKDFHSSMMKPSMEYLERLWQVMNAIVGTPTLFNGTEFAQTGYETLNKNVYVDNRNQILHDLKNDPRYKDMFDRMYAASDLYNQPQMSAIREGFPVLCKVNPPKGAKFDFKGANQGALEYFVSQISSHGGLEHVDELFKDDKVPTPDEITKELGIASDNNNPKNLEKYYKDGTLKEFYNFKQSTKNAVSFLPVFKYDDKGSKVLSIITNNGIPQGEYAYKASGNVTLNTNLEIESIDVVDDNNQSPLPEGTKLKKKVYSNGKYETEKDEKGNDIIYAIKDKQLVRADGQKIKFEDTVVNFFVDKTPSIVRGPQNPVIQ
ncbi:MAG: hypothetical protein IJ877_01815 [Candidatus Gastranaerophilales bacterium]|nr:hypothetical protein [Candidatus Gastranaerophilales bacterium]